MTFNILVLQSLFLADNIDIMMTYILLDKTIVIFSNFMTKRIFTKTIVGKEK